MDALGDAPNVIIFPPLVPVTTLVVAAVLQWFWPLGFVADLAIAWRLPVGVVLVISGIELMASGRRSLTKGGTNVNPSQPTLVLVVRGVYEWTRNPLYVGGCAVMWGAALLFALDWLPLIFPLSLVVLHFGIIKPEEEYLERKFGDVYREYKSHVRRYF